MAVGGLAPAPVLQVSDQNGVPLPSAKLFTFASGTAVPAVIYRDAALTVPWTNPAIADSGGFFISIYMPAEAQKWILEDQFSVVQWTVDPVTGITPGAGGIIGIGAVLFPMFGDAESPITSTTIVPGGTVDACHAGTNLYVVDSALIPAGTYVLQAMIAGTGGANTVSVSLVDLDSAPNTPIATASGVSATGIQVTSAAIVFSTPGVGHRYGLKTTVSSGVGYCWAADLIRSA